MFLVGLMSSFLWLRNLVCGVFLVGSTFAQILPPPADEMIDFALMGGAFFTTRAEVEKDLYTKALQAMFKLGGERRQSLVVENFFDEKALYEQFKQRKVFMAGVSQQFFAMYREDLDLVPLVAPIVEGKKRQRFVIFTRVKHEQVKTLSDLQDKVLATPMYMNRWFYNLSRTDEMPRLVQLERMPESKSVIMATLYGQADAGMLWESFLDNFLQLKPHLVDQIQVLGESHSWIQPPIVCRRAVVSKKRRERIKKLFLSANEITEIHTYLGLLEITGFHEVSGDEIIRSWK